ncbi:MAG: HAMP domain-containing sensor histidine kinase [Acutalibacteraceae bacterium]|nr:HAMP domain-containing sensor histidine kinase [Acutalibacteraceae bacterium]
MTKRYKREKKKLFIKITAILLVVCAIVMTSYSFMIYNNTYNSLYNFTRMDCERNLKTTLELFSTAHNSEKSVDYIANRGRVSNEYISNEIRITVADEDGSVNAETSDVLAVAFQNDKQMSYQGTIDYEKFRKSMTDEQYNKIIELLDSKPLVDNLIDYNLLVCTKFYSIATQDANISEIIPKTIQVVTTNGNLDCAQDEVVEIFELNPDTNSKELYVCNSMYRNIIDNDFLEGKYTNKGLIKKAESFLTDSEKISENEYFFDTDNFTSLYYRSYNVPLNDTPNCVIEYAQEFNCLKMCKDEIIYSCIIIALFFIITGVILWIIMWQSVQSQIKIEEKRRVLTDTMAHNLKSPMFVLSGYAENLKANTNPEKREYYADKIIEQTNTMNGIVHKLLDMSKLDSITFKLEKETIDLAKVTEEIINNYSNLPNSKDIKYTKNGKTEITADKRLIKSALENMIDNAVKYSPESSTVNISLEDNLFSITNICRNIETKDLKNIWEPYEKIDKNGGEYSNGLGLSIVRTIFEIHQFKYGVKSEDGKIRFWFLAK